VCSTVERPGKLTQFSMTRTRDLRLLTTTLTKLALKAVPLVGELIVEQLCAVFPQHSNISSVTFSLRLLYIPSSLHRSENWFRTAASVQSTTCQINEFLFRTMLKKRDKTVLFYIPLLHLRWKKATSVV